MNKYLAYKEHVVLKGSVLSLKILKESFCADLNPTFNIRFNNERYINFLNKYKNANIRYII